MNIFKKFFLGAMIAAPLLLAPAKSHAGPISDLLKEIFGDRKKPKHNPPGTPTPGNSVPINGGLILLIAAGLGLGAKMIYDNKAKKMETAPL